LHNSPQHHNDNSNTPNKSIDKTFISPTSSTIHEEEKTSSSQLHGAQGPYYGYDITSSSQDGER